MLYFGISLFVLLFGNTNQIWSFERTKISLRMNCRKQSHELVLIDSGQMRKVHFRIALIALNQIQMIVSTASKLVVPNLNNHCLQLQSHLIHHRLHHKLTLQCIRDLFVKKIETLRLNHVICTKLLVMYYENTLIELISLTSSTILKILMRFFIK